MGDGLYGVDLKQTSKGVYVIEVNDNPNIDAGLKTMYWATNFTARLFVNLNAV